MENKNNLTADQKINIAENIGNLAQDYIEITKLTKKTKTQLVNNDLIKTLETVCGAIKTNLEVL